MKIRFNGMFRTIKKGCAPCGHKVVSGKAFLSTWSPILPSGVMRTFHVNEVYEVSEADGNFLLSYSQVDKDGVRQDTFTKVE